MYQSLEELLNDTITYWVVVMETIPSSATVAGEAQFSVPF